MRVIAQNAIAIAALLFGAMLLGAEAGRRLAGRQSPDSAPENGDFGPIDGAVFALFGLLVAFTFSGAAGRIDERRKLIGEEANAIGTAYARLDLLPPEAEAELREWFRRYVDSRLEVYRKLPDLAAAEAELERGAAIQREIWSRAVLGSRDRDSPVAAMLLLPALNEMIDLATTRRVAAAAHPPSIIFVLLFALAVGCSLMAGTSLSRTGRLRLRSVWFAAAVAITVWVILEMEYPRAGAIRLESADRVLIELRRSMKEASQPPPH